MKMVIAAIAVAATCGASALMAGERTGQGKPTGRMGKSACSFSGLEDYDFGAPVVPGDVQSFGRHPAVNGGVSDSSDNIPNSPGPAAPGIACNPSDFVPD